jgi:hypothetical protein
MDDLKHIEQLLEKYYNGETSLEEERKLRWYFQTRDVPEWLQPEKKMYDYFQKIRQEELSPGFTQKLSKFIDKQQKAQGKTIARTVLLWAGSAAAALIILLTVWLGYKEPFSPYASAFQDTFDDPELAYLETKKVLLMVSEKMNEGTQNLQALDKLNEGVQNLYPVFSFGPGLQRLGKFSKINETIELITK